MLRKKPWHGMFAVVAAVFFGMLAVGCGKDDNPSGGGTPSELNGTWVGEAEELTLNNGSFEIKAEMPVYDDDWEEIGTTPVRVLKGNFSTSGNILTLTPTHIHADIFNAEFGGLIKITEKWYTRSELKTEFKSKFGAALYDAYEFDALIDAMFDEMSVKQVGTYVLNGNSLSITFDDDTSTYTRK